MAKFKVIMNVVVEAESLDEAVTMAGVYMVNKCSQHLPIMTIAKPMPFQSYQTENINLFQQMQNQMFTKGVRLPEATLAMDVKILEQHPEPAARM